MRRSSRPTLGMMRELGAPWIFGSDNPASLLPNTRQITPFDPRDVGAIPGTLAYPTYASEYASTSGRISARSTPRLSIVM